MAIKKVKLTSRWVDPPTGPQRCGLFYTKNNHRANIVELYLGRRPAGAVLGVVNDPEVIRRID
jgi:hypothetical protein